MNNTIKKGECSNKKTKKRLNIGRIQALVFVWSLLALPVFKLFFMWFYTNISTVILAFQDPRTSAWTIDNFSMSLESLLNGGGTLLLCLKNTMIYFSVATFIILPVALVLSYFMYKRILGYRVFRIVFYLPAIISGLVLVTAFTNFIDPKGPLGYIMSKIGKPLPPEGLLGRSSTATMTIVVYVIWTGFTGNVLYYSSAMSRIPMEVLESARLEGITPWKELIYIIFPFVWPIFSVTLILQFSNILAASGPILLFTNGQHDTSTIAFWMFSQVYGSGVVGGSGSYNLLSATGLIFTAIIFPIVLLVRWLTSRIESFEY